MTILTTNNKNFATGNGVTTAFSFTFRCVSATDIKVYKDGVLVSNNDYTVSINSNGVGGTVTFDVAPTNSVQVLLYRFVNETQESHLPNEDDFQQVTLENALDKLTMEVQQLQEQINRALLGSLFNPNGVSFILPAPDSRKALLWHPDESGVLINSTYDPDELYTQASDALTQIADYLAGAEAAEAAALAAKVAAEAARDAAEAASTNVENLVLDSSAFYSFGYVENTVGTDYAAFSSFNISAIARASLGTIDITFGGGGVAIPETAPIIVTPHPLIGLARPIESKVDTTVGDGVMTAMRLTFFAEDSSGENWALIDPPAFSFCMPKLSNATGVSGVSLAGGGGSETIGDMLIYANNGSVTGWYPIPIGTDGQVLTVNTSGYKKAEWADATGGSGGFTGFGSVHSNSVVFENSITIGHIGTGRYSITGATPGSTAVIASIGNGPALFSKVLRPPSTAYDAEIQFYDNGNALVDNDFDVVVS